MRVRSASRPTVPMSEGSSPAPETAAPPVPSRTGFAEPGRILVVDDHAEVAEIIEGETPVKPAKTTKAPKATKEAKGKAAKAEPEAAEA